MAVGPDPTLNPYLAAISTYPLLTPEEMATCAAGAGPDGAGDLQRLVAGNLRLVVKLAHEFHRGRHELADLVQEGNLGLIDAARRFQSDRGVPFASYAAWWIRARIRAFLLANHSLVRLGSTSASRRLFYALQRASQQQLARDGHLDREALAAQFRVSLAELTSLEALLAGDQYAAGGPDPYLAGLADPQPGPEQAYAAAELVATARPAIAAALADLSARDRAIAQGLFLDDERPSLAVLAGRHQLSRERVRRIGVAVATKLRQRLGPLRPLVANG